MICKAVILLLVLPFEAYNNADAIIRSLYRKYISKKNLLNWIDAAQVEKLMNDKLTTYIKNFKVNYIAAVVLIIFTCVFSKEDYLITIFLSALWFGAPFFMYLLCKTPNPENRVLDEKQKKDIKKIAEDTWEYFYL